MDKKKPGNIVGWDRDCVNASEEEGLVGKNCEVPVDDDDDDVGDIRWVEELWLKKRGEEVTGLKMVKQEIKITTSGTSDSRISETRSETIKDSSEKLEREMKPETSSMTEKVPADQEDAEVDGLTEVDAKVALQSYELTSGDAPEKQSKQLTPADAPGTENQDLTPDDTSAINQDPSPAAASEISQDPTPADAPDRRDKVVRSVITQRNCRIPPAYFGPAFDETKFQLQTAYFQHNLGKIINVNTSAKEAHARHMAKKKAARGPAEKTETAMNVALNMKPAVSGDPEPRTATARETGQQETESTAREPGVRQGQEEVPQETAAQSQPSSTGGQGVEGSSRGHPQPPDSTSQPEGTSRAQQTGGQRRGRSSHRPSWKGRGGRKQHEERSPAQRHRLPMGRRPPSGKVEHQQKRHRPLHEMPDRPSDMDQSRDRDQDQRREGDRDMHRNRAGRYMIKREEEMERERQREEEMKHERQIVGREEMERLENRWRDLEEYIVWGSHHQAVQEQQWLMQQESDIETFMQLRMMGDTERQNHLLQEYWDRERQKMMQRVTGNLPRQQWPNNCPEECEEGEEEAWVMEQRRREEEMWDRHVPDRRLQREANRQQLLEAKERHEMHQIVMQRRLLEQQQREEEHNVMRQRDEEQAMRLREEEQAIRLREEEQAIRLREEEQAIRLREEKQAIRLREEKQAMRLREEEQAMRLREEEQAMRLREEEQAMRLREEEQAMRLREEQAMCLREEEQAMRLREEQAMRLREEQAMRLREEQAMRLREEEQAMRLTEEEQAMRLREEQAMRLREEEQAMRLTEEEQVMRLREEQAMRLREEEQAIRLREEQVMRLREEEQAMRLREEEQAMRLREEQAMRLREEQAMRLREEEKAWRLREEEKALRRREEQAMRLREEEKALCQRQKDEVFHRRREEEEAWRQRQDDQERRDEASWSRKRRRPEDQEWPCEATVDKRGRRDHQHQHSSFEPETNSMRVEKVPRSHEVVRSHSRSSVDRAGRSRQRFSSSLHTDHQFVAEWVHSKERQQEHEQPGGDEDRHRDYGQHPGEGQPHHHFPVTQDGPGHGGEHRHRQRHEEYSHAGTSGYRQQYEAFSPTRGRGDHSQQIETSSDNRDGHGWRFEMPSADGDNHRQRFDRRDARQRFEYSPAERATRSRGGSSYKQRKEWSPGTQQHRQSWASSAVTGQRVGHHRGAHCMSRTGRRGRHGRF